MPVWNGSDSITVAEVEAASQVGAAAAITSAGLATATNVTAGTAAVIAGVPDSADVQDACSAAIVFQVSEGIIPSAITIASQVALVATGVPFGFLNLPEHATVTISGAGTSGTLVAAPGGGAQVVVWAILVSCSAAASTFSLTSTGSPYTIGTHQIALGDNLSLSLPFGAIFSGGGGAAIVATKTTLATLTIDVWYSTTPG